MNRKIECIERLLEINSSWAEITEWLVSNKFTDERTVANLIRPRERSEFIYKVLKEQEKDEKIMLLYFEWSILPKETIKITCVTHTEEKLFTYGL